MVFCRTGTPLAYVTSDAATDYGARLTHLPSSLIVMHVASPNSGHVPAEYNQLLNLAELRVQGNMISGLLPSFIVQLRIRSANLAGNQFYGQLPQVWQPDDFCSPTGGFCLNWAGICGQSNLSLCAHQAWCGRNFTVDVQDNAQLCGKSSRYPFFLLAAKIGHRAG